MRTMSRAAAVAALTLTLSAPALGAAHASGNQWKDLVTFDKGHVQACKVETTDTGPWKVKLRVNSRQATARLRASTAAMVKDSATGSEWASGWVAKGDVSGIGTVKLPRGKTATLSIGLAEKNAGTGGSFHAGDIPHC